MLDDNTISPAVTTSARSDGASLIGWFCVQTHAKHEHIAAAQLRQDPELEVFLPRIRYRRATRSGPAWTTEALFPKYLFARFDLATCLRRVRHARAVRGIVHFGNGWPTIPESVISQLQEVIGPEELRVVSSHFKPGDPVEISGGTLGGLQAVVSRVMPNSRRVAVLLDFLGRQTTVELGTEQVILSQGLPPLMAA
jgi:transcriptional antiterminator RfaH